MWSLRLTIWFNIQYYFSKFQCPICIMLKTYYWLLPNTLWENCTVELCVHWPIKSEVVRVCTASTRQTVSVCFSSVQTCPDCGRIAVYSRSLCSVAYHNLKRVVKGWDCRIVLWHWIVVWDKPHKSHFLK